MKVKKTRYEVDKGKLIRQRWLRNTRGGPSSLGSGGAISNPRLLFKLRSREAIAREARSFNDIDFY